MVQPISGEIEIEDEIVHVAHIVCNAALCHYNEDNKCWLVNSLDGDNILELDDHATCKRFRSR
jgi:hypothetical protein